MSQHPQETMQIIIEKHNIELQEKDNIIKNLRGALSIANTIEWKIRENEAVRAAELLQFIGENRESVWESPSPFALGIKILESFKARRELDQSRSPI